MPPTHHAAHRYARIAGFAALAVASVALAIAFRQAIARAAIVAGLASMTGLHVSFGALHVDAHDVVASRIHVENAARETIADVASARVGYAWRDLLPGSAHAFGLTGFDVEGAHLVITRHHDGTLSLPLPKAGSGSAPEAPFIFAGRVRDASLDVY
ncbi:MAG: hypothetical protein WCD38_04850, partial [Candidatus Tumulicola sp.]